MKRTKKQHKLNYIYQGMTLIGRAGRRCRIVLCRGRNYLIEFEDHRRDWCYFIDLRKIQTSEELILQNKLSCQPIQGTIPFQG
jgi:hypothetical protein